MEDKVSLLFGCFVGINAFLIILRSLHVFLLLSFATPAWQMNGIIFHASYVKPSKTSLSLRNSRVFFCFNCFGGLSAFAEGTAWTHTAHWAGVGR